MKGNRPMKTILKISHPPFALFALACFVLAAQARATCQEGCDISNASTFLGDDALLNNFGIANTAIGFNALYFNTAGVANTATGVAKELISLPQSWQRIRAIFCKCRCATVLPLQTAVNRLPTSPRTLSSRCTF